MKNAWLLAGEDVFLSAPAFSQTFVIVAKQGTTTAAVSNGSTVGFVAQRIGAEVTTEFSFTYRGSATANVLNVDLIGPTDFTLVSPPALPASIAAGSEFRLTVRFQASGGDRVTSLLLLTVNELPPAGPAGSPAPQPTANAFVSLNLAGTAPDLTFAYFLQSEGNLSPLVAGSTILFPETPAGTTAQAVVVALNRGTAPGGLKGIRLEGGDFQLLGVPLLPGTLEGGRELRFTVRYAPKQNGSANGRLHFELDGSTVTVGIQGEAVGPVFAYQLVEGETETPLAANQALWLEETAVGVTRDFVVVIRNTGNAAGTIAAINLVGAGFLLTDVPFLPTTLAAGSSAFFGFRFEPARPGGVIGRMRIGNDTFELRATVAGGRLVFSYTAGERTLTVAPNGTLTVSPVVVGLSSAFEFRIRNEGPGETSVSSIGIGGAGFMIETLPSLPLTLAAGEEITVPVVFQPAAVGAATAQLRVDGNTFALSGAGAQPPPLPPVRFEGAGGSHQPLEQPAVGLTLESAYPFALRGTLTLTAEADSAGASDAAVQFATGGRSVAFTIPANGTQAVFLNNSTRIRLQTGTLAGRIVLAATFAAASSGYDLTPESPPRQTLAVAAGPPRLLDLQVTSSGPAGLQITATGYTPTRGLSSLELELTPVAGYRFPAEKLTFDLAGPSAVWFQGAGSQGYGGLFSVSVSIGAQGLPENRTLYEFLKTVSAGIANSLGSSERVNRIIQ